MSIDLVHARVVDALKQLKLGHTAERLDAALSEAARSSPTFLDFLVGVLREGMGSKQRRRVQMGISIAHFPVVKTLDDFDFKFQPSIDQKLMRELATGRFIASADNVLLFGPPGVGKSHCGDRARSLRRRGWLLGLVCHDGRPPGRPARRP